MTIQRLLDLDITERRGSCCEEDKTKKSFENKSKSEVTDHGRVQIGGIS